MGDSRLHTKLIREATELVSLAGGNSSNPTRVQMVLGFLAKFVKGYEDTTVQVIDALKLVRQIIPPREGNVVKPEEMFADAEAVVRALGVYQQAASSGELVAKSGVDAAIAGFLRETARRMSDEADGTRGVPALHAADLEHMAADLMRGYDTPLPRHTGATFHRGGIVTGTGEKIDLSKMLRDEMILVPMSDGPICAVCGEEGCSGHEDGSEGCELYP